MSLFVGNLAFINNLEYMDGVKIGVLTGSLMSTLFGYFLLLISSKKMIDQKIIKIASKSKFYGLKKRLYA